MSPAEKFPHPSELYFPDKERERIELFTSQLSELAVVRPHGIALDFNEPDPVNEAITRFKCYETIGAASLYVNSREVQSSAQAPVGFEPRVARAGQHSRNGVFFGDLIFNDQQNISVAVKPHMTDPIDSCLLDYCNNEAVEQLHIDGLTPIGFLLHQGKPAYSLTKLDKSLTTLDSIDWGNFLVDMDLEMSELWRAVARRMAFIHSLGSIVHGDLAARNIATTNEGNVFFIDWERANISLQKPRDAETRYSFSYSDTSTLLESMYKPPTDKFKAGIGLLYGKTEEGAWTTFRALFLDEYVATRRDFLMTMRRPHNDMKEVDEELNVLEASLREDIVMYFRNQDSHA